MVQVDIDNGVDVMDKDRVFLEDSGIDEAYGVIAACPCDHFAASGARWFKDKDKQGITQMGIDLVIRAL